jgi:hypothetical protein
MTMGTRERAEFVNAYTLVLITTWSDDAFAAKLGTDPVAALGECGINLPAGASVEVLREIDPDQEGNLDVQIEAWERGTETRRFSLYVPDTPPIDTAELTEADLDVIAHGMSACCCCPCCCCV